MDDMKWNIYYWLVQMSNGIQRRILSFFQSIEYNSFSAFNYICDISVDRRLRQERHHEENSYYYRIKCRLSADNRELFSKITDRKFYFYLFVGWFAILYNEFKKELEIVGGPEFSNSYLNHTLSDFNEVFLSEYN